MKYSFAIATSLIVVLFASCGQAEKKQEKAAQKTAYKIMPLAPGQISSTLRLPGVLEPYQFVQVYPKISGFIKNITVDRGSVVHKGQVLITLEAPEIEEHVASAKLKFTQANTMYLASKDRYQRLLQTSKTPGTVSAFDLASAESKMQADAANAQGEEANYRAQQQLSRYLVVTAPFDGVVTERNVHPGALVGPGTQGAKPMLLIQQQSKLRLVVNIPEEYTAGIKNNSEVHFNVNALPGKDFTGTVSRSSGTLSSNFRSETVEVDVPNPSHLFKAGMYAEVVLPVEGSVNAHIVPKSAVVTTTERKYIIADNNGEANWVDVTEGNQRGDSCEIFCNLHDGDRIIANASYQVKNGARIEK